MGTFERMYNMEMWERTLREDAELRAKRAQLDHPLVTLIFDVMTENDLPISKIRIPDLVLKKMDVPHGERHDVKRLILNRLAVLVHQGRLDRVGDSYVTLPRNQDKYKAYQQGIEETIKNLPEPQLR